MYLAASLILALVFALALNASISKYSSAWYWGAVLLVILECVYYKMELMTVFPDWFTIYFVNLFKRGVFPTALFILVMYAGALSPDWIVTRKLKKIRRELSIIACFLSLGHNLIYGLVYFVQFFTNPGKMGLQYCIASFISLVMLIIMIPLMITSFEWVHKRMKGSSWKRLQKWAYGFYALLYIHVMVLWIMHVDRKWLGITVYTVVFGGYLLLKIRKETR